MITGIDHVVIAVKDLPQTIKTYERLGFNVIPGGRHDSCTHNALIGFEDGSYIELLAFYEDCEDHVWWDRLRASGGGLIDYCMATDDIRADLAGFHAQGVEAGDLTAGGRSRPDGYEVKWINNKVGGEFQGRLPFIIEDISPRAQRLPSETTQANGVTGIHKLSLVTEDAGRYAAIMGAVLGQTGQSFVDENLLARGFRFTIASHILEYLSPRAATSPLQAHLGPQSPPAYRVCFKTGGHPATIAPEQAAGVRIELIRVD